jgi:large subunit ribosomal protein L19
MTEITVSDLRTGMLVRLHEKIQDVNPKGDIRERIQVFEGIILGFKGGSASRTFTIRKESNGYGVEKIFPMTSPNITKLELVKQYKVRQSKIGYLRHFGRKLKEMLRGKKK